MSADKFLTDNWDKGWPRDTWTTADVVKFANIYASSQYGGNMQTILNGGESLDVTAQQAERLITLGLIYKCDDKQCGELHHLNNGVTWEQLEHAIKEPA